MICYTVYKYCCDDISLIENYDEAINSNEMYDCHHRLETDKHMSKKELIDNDLYLYRPASELIFLTRSEHMSLHTKGKKFGPHSEETKHKQSKANKGQIPWNKGIKTGKHRIYDKNGKFHYE